MIAKLIELIGKRAEIDRIHDQGGKNCAKCLWMMKKRLEGARRLESVGIY
jgi:hypothetical protein